MAVPLIARLPGVKEAPKMGSVMDVLPTALGRIGVETKTFDLIDGVDLVKERRSAIVSANEQLLEERSLVVRNHGYKAHFHITSPDLDSINKMHLVFLTDKDDKFISLPNAVEYDRFLRSHVPELFVPDGKLGFQLFEPL